MTPRHWIATPLLALSLAACGGGGGSSTPPTSFSISGTLTSAANTAIDSDTNDPFSSPVSNNTPTTAQDVPNLFLLGGFATAAPTGVPGDVFANLADEFDAFRSTLQTGQIITLTIADHPGGSQVTPDLDLFLYDASDTTLIAGSAGDTRTETVTVPADGEYFILVNAINGQSNYTLNVVAAPAGAALPVPEFVPGEILVRLEEAMLPLAVGDTLGYFATQTGLRKKAGASGRPALFTLPRDAMSRMQTLMALGVENPGMSWGGFDQSDTDARLRHDTLVAIKALRQRADVRSADPNYIHRPLATPNDQYYGLQWHYPLINLPQAWDIETGTTKSVTVAVVDTGVFLAHPDLGASLVAGYDFISNPTIANDGDGIDANPDDPGDGLIAGSSSFHGTHVAGTVAAASDNTNGVAGVSWGADIMPIRVLGVGGGTTYDILQGNFYAAGLPNDSNSVPGTPADIINMSLGCLNCYSQTEQDAYTQIRNAGVIIIAAAGNENTSAPGYPASYAGVVSVSAVDYLKQRAPYSNYGATVDVAAPGGNMAIDLSGDGYPDGVLSTHVDESTGTRQASYNFLQGTSMAAPHMAGVVALMESIAPVDVTPDALDGWLQSGSITEDVAGNGAATRDDVYGWGLIDAAKAVQTASSGVIPTLLTVTPNTLDFGSLATVLTLSLGESGPGTVEVTSVTETSPWLSIAGPGTGDGLGDYTVTADRTGLSDGSYTAVVTVAYTVDAAPRTLGIPVTLSVNTGGGAGTGADTGFTWILAIDATTLQTVAVDTAANVDGEYSYTLTGIPNGEYYIVAGTDSDNDNILCDAGEACGAYPTLGLLERVIVQDGNISGLDFGLTFPIEIGSTALSKALDADRPGFSKSVSIKRTEGTLP